MDILVKLKSESKMCDVLRKALDWLIIEVTEGEMCELVWE
jgi:hypothetical protein